jgi:hypothetical protein
MATKVYDVTADGLDGTDETFGTDIANKNQRFTLFYVNDLDVDITTAAKLTRKDDTAFDDAVTPHTHRTSLLESGMQMYCLMTRGNALVRQCRSTGHRRMER